MTSSLKRKTDAIQFINSILLRFSEFSRAHLDLHKGTLELLALSHYFLSDYQAQDFMKQLKKSVTLLGKVHHKTLHSLEVERLQIPKHSLDWILQGQPGHWECDGFLIKRDLESLSVEEMRLISRLVKNFFLGRLVAGDELGSAESIREEEVIQVNLEKIHFGELGEGSWMAYRDDFRIAVFPVNTHEEP